MPIEESGSDQDLRASHTEPDPTNRLAHRLWSQGVIPVIRIDRSSSATDAAKALDAGGLPGAEITFRTPAAAASIRAIATNIPSFLVGAGTILNVEQAQIAIDAGARFLVTPGFDQRVVEFSQTRRTPCIPGVMTPTEVMSALRAGVSTVKVFPIAALGGLTYLRHLTGPFPSVRFFPSGGIDLSNLPPYLQEPAVLAIGGSWMVPPALLRAKDWTGVQRMASEAAAVVVAVRPRVPVR